MDRKRCQAGRTPRTRTHARWEKFSRADARNCRHGHASRGTGDQAVIKDVDTMEVDYVDAGQDVSIKIEEVTQNATARIDKLKNKTND